MLTTVPPERVHPLKGKSRPKIEAPVAWEWIEEPVPEVRRRSARQELFDLLEKLEVGRAVRVNRRDQVLKGVISDHRKRHPGETFKYRLVAEEPIRRAGMLPVYWTKIWRIA